MCVVQGLFLNIYFILLTFLPSVGTDSFQGVISKDFRGQVQTAIMLSTVTQTQR